MLPLDNQTETKNTIQQHLGLIKLPSFFLRWEILTNANFSLDMKTNSCFRMKHTFAESVESCGLSDTSSSSER